MGLFWVQPRERTNEWGYSKAATPTGKDCLLMVPNTASCNQARRKQVKNWREHQNPEFCLKSTSKSRSKK